MESLNIESLLYLNNAVLRPWEIEEIFCNKNVVSISPEKKRKEQWQKRRCLKEMFDFLNGIIEQNIDIPVAAVQSTPKTRKNTKTA